MAVSLATETVLGVERGREWEKKYCELWTNAVLEKGTKGHIKERGCPRKYRVWFLQLFGKAMQE